MEERTERARRKWDRHAAAYDRQMAFFERALFAGGREWAVPRSSKRCWRSPSERAGTSSSIQGIRLTGIDFRPKMLDIARGRASELGREVDLRLGDAQALEFHVRSPILAVRMGQWILEPISRVQGDTLVREPLVPIKGVGFEVELVERRKWGIVERAVARKPEVG